MATNPYVNKVLFGDQVIMDITASNVGPDDVKRGKRFYDNTGALRIGTLSAYIEHDANVLHRCDVLNINAPSSSEEGTPCFYLGDMDMREMLVVMTVDSAKNNCYLETLANDGTVSRITLVGTLGGYADTVKIRQVFFVDAYTVLVVYSWSNSTSGRNHDYLWATRSIHKKLDGTITDPANNYTSIKTAYAASTLKNWYYLPSFFTDLNNNLLMRHQQITSSNNNNTLLITEYTETRNLQYSAVDTINVYTWTSVGSDGNGSYDNRFSYPGNNLKSRGGICYMNMYYSKPYITLRLRGEEVNYPLKNSIDAIVSDTTNRYKLEVILPDNPDGNTEEGPSPTTGFPYRHIGILGLLKDKTTLVTIRCDITGMDENDEYIYGLYLDFWRFNAAGKTLTYISSYTLLDESFNPTLPRFPKTWDDIVQFAYLGMDNIFYYRFLDTYGNYASRIQINMIQNPPIYILDDIMYDVNNGYQGRLAMSNFSTSKSDNLMNVYFT